jgi:iron complex outermembrane receptor protein
LAGNRACPARSRPTTLRLTTNPACYGARYYESSLGENRVAGGFPAFSDTDVWGAAVTLDWQFDKMELVSISAYRELNASSQRDFDATPLVIAHFSDVFDQWQVSQELQLKGSSFSDRLDWILGVLLQGEGR